MTVPKLELPSGCRLSLSLVLRCGTPQQSMGPQRSRSLPPSPAICAPNNGLNPGPMASADQVAAQCLMAYYGDIAFVSQLCGRFASEEGNLELAAPLAEAHELLERIVSQNTSNTPPPSDRQPEWPLHPDLIRFDVPLQRMTTQLRFLRKWKPRFYVLRNLRLYYSNGKRGHSDSHEGSLSFMRSNPEPDEHYCIDLRQWFARTLILFTATLSHDCPGTHLRVHLAWLP